jgi:ribosome-binding ATPase YchF (GTP1/OBG family)
VIEALRAGRPARTGPPPADAPDAMRLLQPLTAKPVLYVANVGEGETEVPESVARHASGAGARAVAVSARLEAELSELDDEEAAAMRADLGVPDSGLALVVRGAFALLDLIQFFTAGEGREARAHAIERGTTAWGAAGEIHSDIQRGFVRAEVVAWDELVDAVGYAGARERGTLRLEGRDYVMTDGDVITVKFTP